MPTVRKYKEGEAGNNGHWESVASSDATEIYSANSFLTGTEPELSVEDILLRDREDIETLKKNVSWLARHGGGGYGGGGGGSTSNNNANVIIIGPRGEGEDSGGVKEIVWSTDIVSIPYKITSRSNSTYNVSIRVDGNLVYTQNNVTKNTRYYIPAYVLGITSKSVTLRVFAIDEYANEFSASCEIKVSTVDLTLLDRELLVTNDELVNQHIPISLNYKVSIPGNYLLLYNRGQIIYRNENFYNSKGEKLTDLNQYRGLTISETGLNTLELPIDELTYYQNGNYIPILPPDIAIGTYTLQFQLVNRDNFSMFSNVQQISIAVVTTDGLSIIVLVGQEESPYIASLDSTLYLRFKVVSRDGLGTFDYIISQIDNSDYVLTGRKNIGNEVTISVSPQDLGITNSGEYVLKIVASVDETNSAIAYMYLNITEPNAARLEAYMEDLQGDVIFDFTVDAGTNGPINANTFKESSSFIMPYTTTFKGGHSVAKKVTTDFCVYNKGVDSIYNAKYITLNHRAYARIVPHQYSSGDGPEYLEYNSWFPDGTSSLNSLITRNRYYFTLDIAYYIDKCDSDCTILKFGNYDPTVTNSSGEGIVITAQKYYIKFEGEKIVGTIQDEGFTNLTICFGMHSSQNKITIFKNGVYHQQVTIEAQSFGYYFSRFSEIFLACSSVDNNGAVHDGVNLRLYSIRLFSKELNVGQVICNYINNYACYKTLGQNDEKDQNLVRHLLEINSIKPDALVEGGTENISEIFNFKTGQYTWNLSSTTDGVDIPQSLFNLPIPIVTLTTSWWTEDNFTDTTTIADPDENCIFNYRPAGESSYIGAGRHVTVSVQGTTTARYTIKNLDITFDDNTTFSPIDTWFPENVFTLKADIVDSGHINNAVIGKFINDCYNNEEKSLMNTSAFPMKGKVDESKNKWKTLPQSVTPKVTIEGFPVLLIMNFLTNSGTRNVKIIGIYSFNLGRKSIYNQGFEIPKKFTECVEGGTITHELDPSEIHFPSYFGKCICESDHYAYCYEGLRVLNTTKKDMGINSDDYHFVEIKNLYTLPPDNNLSHAPVNGTEYVQWNSEFLLDKSGNKIEWNSTNVHKYKINPNGYFWSTDESYVTGLWRNEYASEETSGGAFNAFTALCKCVASKLEYTKGTVRYFYGNSVPKWRINSVSESQTQGGDEQSGVDMVDTGESFTITQEDVKTDIELSVKNTAFYYVVALLFGLNDNFGKNLQFKAWKPKDGSSFFWSPAFYDMDTALGLNNNGLEEVSPILLDYSITNDLNGKFIKLFGDAVGKENDLTRVFSNRLWGAIESSTFIEKYNNDYDGYTGYRFYAKTWSDLRCYILKDVDTFVDEYFHTQLDNCSQFLINYDYSVKYIDKTEQSMLHGTRLDFIRQWMKERVYFLDSIFGYDSEMNNYLYHPSYNNLAYEIPYLDQIRVVHNSGTIRIPVVTNSPVIIHTNIGSTNYSNTFVPSNTPTEIIVSNSEAASAEQVIINNSSCIKSFPDLHQLNITNIIADDSRYVRDTTGTAIYSENVPSSIQRQLGNFRNLKVLNLSGNRTINTNINLFNLFKTWDPGNRGTPSEFKLEEIDYSNIQVDTPLSVNLRGISTTNPDVPSIYVDGPFRNIVSINVSNSTVSSIYIPTNVSLIYLNVSNSSVEDVSLEGQPLLGNVNFSGCTNLRNVSLLNCEKITEVTLDSSNKSIESVSISGCNSLNKITINGSTLSRLPSIIIQSCENLTEINITNCIKSSDPNLAETEARKCIEVLDCENLTTINVTNSQFYGIFTDDTSIKKLRTLNAYQSGLAYLGKKITESSSSQDIDLFKNNPEINLTNCLEPKETYEETVFSIRFQEDAVVKKVRLPNIKLQPIVLRANNLFRSCPKLTTVIGNFIIEGTGTFSVCPSLKLFPDTTLTNTGIGNGNINLLSGTKRLHPKEITDSQGNSIIERDPNLGNTERVKWFAGDNINFILRRNISNSTDGSNGLFGGQSDTSIENEKGANLSNFEIYYSLFNIYNGTNTNQKPKSIKYMFGELGTRGGSRRDFNWTSAVDNSPSIHMFEHCGGVTTADSIFYHTTLASSLYRAYSPTKTGDDFNNDGILSPLTKCGSFYTILPGNWYCDNNLLRLTDSNFSVGSFQSLSPLFVISNINERTYDEVAEIRERVATGLTDSDTNEIGDLSNFFINCPSLSSLKFCFNRSSSLIINFQKLDQAGGNSLGFKNMAQILDSFLCYGGIGELKLKDLFNNETAQAKLTTIYDSFHFENPIKLLLASEEVISVKLEFTLEEYNSTTNTGTFAGFTNLTKLGAYDGNNNNARGTDVCPFLGNGLDKRVIFSSGANTPPYPELELPHVLDVHSKWINVDGLFSECHCVVDNGNGTYSELVPAISIPGSLFKSLNFTNLTSLYACFYDFNSPMKLVGEGFSNCSALADVSYLFGRSNKKRIIESELPLRLFYTGQFDASRVLQGSFKTETIQVDGYIQTGGKRTAYKRNSELSDGESIIVTDYYYDFKPTEDTNTIILTPVTSTYSKTVTNSSSGSSSVQSGIFQLGNVEGWGELLKYDTGADGKYHYVSYNNPITTMTGCFLNQNIPTFSSPSINADLVNYAEPPEDCNTFAPFPFVKSLTNNSWTEEKNQNLNRKTLMWQYDGNAKRYYEWVTEISDPTNSENYINIALTDRLLDQSGNNVFSNYFGENGLTLGYENLDEIIAVPGVNPDTYQLLSKNDSTITITTKDKSGYLGTASTQSSNFCIPPDLFRYSSANVVITDIFNGCGVEGISSTRLSRIYESPFVTSLQSDGYGLIGRLCPYLLSPIPSCRSMSGAFKECRWLGYYMEDAHNSIPAVSYTIPKTFFSYLVGGATTINLSSTFEATTYPVSIDLNVFKFPGLSKAPTLRLEGTFRNLTIVDGSASNKAQLSSVFRNNQFTYNSLIQTFANTQGTTWGENTQYIKFNSVFGNNASNDGTRVFYGYKSTAVEHEISKTVSTADNRENYVTVS